MAISSASYFTNAIVGTPQVGADVEIYDAHSVPKFALGTKIESSDGNIYRYSHFGEDTAAGLVVSTDISETCQADADNVIIAPSATYQMSDEQSGVYPGAIGSKYVVITLASITANQFAGGYFVTTDDTGKGYTFRVMNNTATNNPATGLIRLELDGKLQVALAADTDFAIMGCPYNDLESCDGTDIIAAGVTVRAMDVSDAAYGWIQTKGVCGVLSSGAIAIGSDVVTSTAGNFIVQTDYTAPVCGISLIEGDDGGYGVFKVNFEQLQNRAVGRGLKIPPHK